MSTARRKVILHYHIFKNAGTSVDRMLEDSLGARWANWDRPNAGAKISPSEMEEFILDQPDLLAVSSHQVVPPLPNRSLDIYPIVLMRHPLDRAYSAYLFEWHKQKQASGEDASFDAYVLDRFQNPRANAIEDFQAFHFANRGFDSKRVAPGRPDEDVLQNARGFLQSLPVFGLVERYADYMARLKKAWGPIFPELNFEVHHANALQKEDQSLGQKVAALKASMKPEVYSELVLRNQLDLRLYEYAMARYELMDVDAR